MNSYSLAADGHRWWWGPALAGTAATAGIMAVVALPIAGQAMPVQTTRHEPSPTYVVPGADNPSSQLITGNCFLFRARWNVALDGPQPTCTRALRIADPERSGVVRPGLDWKP